MSTFVWSVLFFALIVLVFVAITRAADRRRIKDIESGKRPSIALENLFSENSPVKKCLGGLSPFHRWVMSSLTSTYTIPGSSIEERRMGVSAECQKCGSRTTAEVDEKHWWMFGLNDHRVRHMDMTVLDHRSRETLRRYEEGEFTKDPPKPGASPNPTAGGQ